MSDDNALPLITPAEANAVPVYSCHVILTPSDDGRVAGRAANLSGIEATGSSERDVLTAVMKQFKAVVVEYSEKNEPVPFVNPPEKPADGELERFIPVHL